MTATAGTEETSKHFTRRQSSVTQTQQVSTQLHYTVKSETVVNSIHLKVLPVLPIKIVLLMRSVLHLTKCHQVILFLAKLCSIFKLVSQIVQPSTGLDTQTVQLTASH